MLPVALRNPSKPHAIGRPGLSPCYVALFFRAGHRCPVALSASGRNYRGTKVEVGEDSKKSRAKRRGRRRELRPRPHPRRPAVADRPPWIQSKKTASLQCGYGFARAPHLPPTSRCGARVVGRTRVIVGLDRHRHRSRLFSRQAMALDGTTPRQAIPQTTPGR